MLLHVLLAGHDLDARARVGDGDGLWMHGPNKVPLVARVNDLRTFLLARPENLCEWMFVKLACPMLSVQISSPSEAYERTGSLEKMGPSGTLFTRYALLFWTKVQFK